MIPRRLRPSVPFLVFTLPLVVYLACLNGVWATDHPTSFLDLDYAIYANHSFVIGKVGQYVKNSVDIFPYKGYYYTASAPGSAVLAYPLVSLGFYLEGGFTVHGKVMLLSEAFVAIANSLAVLILYQVGRKFFCSERSAVFVAFAYAFSTISWPFATYFFQSDVSSLFVMLGVYLVLDAKRNRTEDFSKVKVALCGVALGTALTVDYVDAILLPLFFGYLFLSSRGPLVAKSKGAVIFLATALLGVCLLLSYNSVSFGSPFTTSEQLYLGSSGPFSGFSYYLPAGLLLNFFTPLRGLFVYSPVMVIGVIGFYRKLGFSYFDTRIFFLLTLSLGIIIPYSMWYGPEAGISFGPRFLVPAMPLLLLPIGSVIDASKGKRVVVLSYILYSVGVVVNGLAALVTAIPPSLSWLSSPFLSDVWPAFSGGRLDVWWISQIGGFWMAGVVLIVSIAAVSPLVGDLRRTVLGVQRPQRTQAPTTVAGSRLTSE